MKPASSRASKPQLNPIRVGLLGIGTVGGGTWEVLRRNADEIQRRAGRAIRITMVADKAVERARAIVKGKAKVVERRVARWSARRTSTSSSN